MWPRSSRVGLSPCPTPSPALPDSSSPPSHAPSGLPGSAPGALDLGPMTIIKCGCVCMCAVSETRSQPYLTSVKGQEVKANLTKIVKFGVEHTGSEGKMSKGSQSSQAYMCDSEHHCIQIFSWSLEFI